MKKKKKNLRKKNKLKKKKKILTKLPNCPKITWNVPSLSGDTYESSVSVGWRWYAVILIVKYY